MSAVAGATVECARHYQLGAVAFSVQEAPPEALEDFERLYGRHRRKTPGNTALKIAARPMERAWWRRPRFVIEGDGLAIFSKCMAAEVVPHLEWAINWRVVDRYTAYVQIHAAALAYRGRAMLLVGPSGSGKSTLAAALLTRGWTYLTDECALIDPLTLQISPFPKALCIKAGSFPVVAELGLPLWRRRHYAKAFKGPIGYVDPAAANAHVAEEPCPVGHIVLLRYQPDAGPRLTELSRAAAVLALLRNTFKPLAHGDSLVPCVARLVRQANCCELAGADAGATADALTEFVASSARGPTASAAH